MSDLVAFYSGEVVHPDGYTLDGILAEDDYWLEEKHNYIQWLFPLNKPSIAVPDSPVIGGQEVAQFRASSEIRIKLMLSFERMLKFYGFRLSFDPDNHPKVVKVPNFCARKSNWLTLQNHNLLRISRILESMTLLGFPEMALAFFATLKDIFQDNPLDIGETTLNYWEQAVEVKRSNFL
jgi:hypothetical protein